MHQRANRSGHGVRRVSFDGEWNRDFCIAGGLVAVYCPFPGYIVDGRVHAAGIRILRHHSHRQAGQERERTVQYRHSGERHLSRRFPAQRFQRNISLQEGRSLEAGQTRMLPQ